MGKAFKSQASSGRLSGTALGAGFGTGAFFSTSLISHVYEPPDLSGIADPHVVVQFKNLMKKDGTTKAKALEEITSHVTGRKNDIEDPFLSAFAVLYPRLSIDADRRVRQLSHALLGHVVTQGAKRMVPYLPKVAGPWLCGAQDPDRGVVRSAETSFKQAFNTQDKSAQFRKVFHRHVIDFCRDVITNETPGTLSDPRTISKEDSEGIYYRVVTASLQVVLNFLGTLNPTELTKIEDSYIAIISNRALLDFICAPDPPTRAAAVRLTRVCIDNEVLKPHFDTQLLASALLNKALPADQTATAGDILGLLVLLTELRPTIWSDDGAKKSPVARFRSFVKKGSQSSSSEYWEHVPRLLDRIPPEVLPHDETSIEEWTKSVISGVSQRPEPRHVLSGWLTYLNLCNRMRERLPESNREKFWSSWVLPVVEQYLFPNDDRKNWSLSVAKPQSIAAQAFAGGASTSLLTGVWSEYTSRLIEVMKMSQPESSTAFEKSQTSVGESWHRWAELQFALLSGQATISEDLKKALAAETVKVARAAIDLLNARNGKPFGAAMLIGDLLRHEQHFDSAAGSLRELLLPFLRDVAPRLLSSPSGLTLTKAVFHLNHGPDFEQVWKAWASELPKIPAKEEDNAWKIRFLTESHSRDRGVLARQDQNVQRFLRSYLQAPRHTTLDRAVSKELMDIMDTDTLDSLLADLTSALSTLDQTEAAIETLEALDQLQPGIVRSFATSDAGTNLLPEITAIQQAAPEGISAKAGRLHDRLLGVDGAPVSPSSSMQLLRRELASANATSMPLENMKDIVRSLLMQDVDGMLVLLSQLADQWQTSLRAASTTGVATSLACMSPLGGVVHLVSDDEQRRQQPSFDSEGFSQPLRIASVALLAISNTSPSDARDHALLLNLLSSTAFLLDDNINVRNSNDLYIRPARASSTSLMSEMVADSRALVNHHLKDSGLDGELMAEYSDLTLDAINSVDVIDFNRARSYVSAYAELYEARGMPKQKLVAAEEDLKTFQNDGNIFAVCSMVAVLSPHLGSSAYLQRLLNELIANITAAENVDPLTRKTFEDLVVLNLILQGEGDITGVVQKHRIVMLVKHLTNWLGKARSSAVVRSEVAVGLQYLVRAIPDIYGEHWTGMLENIAAIWSQGLVSAPQTQLDEGRLLLIHSSLRLHSALPALSRQEEVNEDLSDALKEQKSALQQGLIKLLTDRREVADIDHAPLKIVNELVARKAQNVELDETTIGDVYPQLDSISPSLQRAAFKLLRYHVDKAAEKVSFDAALEKKTAHLPEELLSLILEVPDADDFFSAPPDEADTRPLMTYLLSWLLVLAHFEKASTKVRADYAEELRSSDHLPPLLDLTYDFLGHTVGRPVDASKFPITTCEPDTEDNAEKDMQAILIHLFYLSLLYLPGLVKSHYLTLASRLQTNAISSWTAKHISPLVISSLFDKVTSWTETFRSDADFSAFSVKVSAKAREVTASYTIDEQAMSILVSLPEAYPLSGASVTGLSRAALDPKKWQSWLRNCQAVIQFSDGDLVDGLAAWRRNVTGALRGQGECAICYSVISGDKQLPTKKCATCKNSFHNSCLFKWFRTSNSSSCPLCRQGWSYSG